MTADRFKNFHRTFRIEPDRDGAINIMRYSNGRVSIVIDGGRAAETGAGPICLQFSETVALEMMRGLRALFGDVT
jgi:hypothetical protein